MLRELLTIASRVGRPGTLLQLGDAAGRRLYLTAAMSPLSIIVGLEYDDAAELHAALGSWLREHEETPALYELAGGSWRELGEAPLVAGRIGASLADAAATVQNCTVAGGQLVPSDQGGRPAV